MIMDSLSGPAVPVLSPSALEAQPRAAEPERSRFTVPDFAVRKSTGQKIAMITAYDATFARLVDAAGADVILVGDSVGTVMQGHSTTIPVELDHMVYHTEMVARGARKALIVGDLPFGSYQAGPTQGVMSAVRLIKAGAGCVKLEGGVAMADTISALTAVDIPVMGHIGLTPQSFHRMGGHRVQGRTGGAQAGGRERLLDDALAVEQAGACALVIEGVPADVAEEITCRASIPTIGIGAGVGCDGQVLVLHDVLGLGERQFKFARSYVNLGDQVIAAAQAYVGEVRGGQWPDDAHSFH
jgi:3-methyl-2-oxobutanoate hydroxymethyltransferase